ncbi:type IV pili methyl-accepting chemotaxis transducer N-terminal domain-containing protein [Seohaeicola nanhaiensis]|uniref:Type IV pili methyl-accepting chemotaxis transducer N-terminal domain-containing protein n=1 Tax=Seohaeicola nanhaiensis TaxID=1387282 RepID=A0ABV9KJN3_9RHOB
MSRKHVLLSLVLAAVLWPLPREAPAAEPAKSGVDLRRQVNLAGRQRMLSQQIVMMLCMAHQGVKPAETGAAARVAIRDFDRVLKGLRHGDADLGLPVETHPDVLRHLAAVETLWPQFRGRAQAVSDAAGLAELRAIAPDIVARMNDAVQAISASGTTGENAELSKVVDVAGRQRMFLVRIAMETCLGAAGIDVEAERARAAASMDVFETSLAQLREGDSAAGIIAPPVWEIEAMLELVHADWLKMKDLIRQAQAAGDAAVLNSLLEQTQKTLANMNETVWMYENL